MKDKLAYLAGLFDGEGCVTYKQYWSSKRENRPRKYYCWRQGFRDAYEIAKAIEPYAVTKKTELQNIIKHYEHKA